LNKPTPKEALLNALYKTKASRFNAHARLHWQHKLAHYSLLCLSLYVICLSIAPKFNNGLFPNPNQSELLSIAMSIFVMGLAAFEANNNRLEEASGLHKNALKINALYRDALLCDTMEDIKNLNAKYDEALEECEFNHQKIDELQFVMFNTWLDCCTRTRATLVWVPQFIIHYGIHIFFIFGPLAYLLAIS